MPEFAHPWILVLTPLPFVAAWMWSRRRHTGILHPSTDRLISLPPGKTRIARAVGTALRCLGMLALIFALAGIRWPDPGSRFTTRGIAIYVVLDVSGSMAETDYSWDGKAISRLDAAKKVLELFVQGGVGPADSHLSGRPHDLIGLATCSRYPEVLCPLTLDHTALVQMIRQEQPRRLPQESQTNLGDAVALAVQHLVKARPTRKVLVLVTDGEHNVPAPALTPAAATSLAAAVDIPLYTIDMGPVDENGNTVTPAEKNSNHGLARTSLADMAKFTGGKYFLARDTSALASACQGIDDLENDSLESPLFRKYYEGGIWLGMVALAALGSVWFLETLVWPFYP